MASGATSSRGSTAGFSNPGSSISAVGSSSGFSNSGPVPMAVAHDIIQGAFARGGVLRAAPTEVPGYSLSFQRNPYDVFSDPMFDRRHAAGLDYGRNDQSQIMDRHEARGQIYGTSGSPYPMMMGFPGQTYNSSSGGFQGASYPQNNFIGCSGGGVDYTGQ